MLANWRPLPAVSLQKQAAYGLTFLTGYRWSKCVDESEEGFFDTDAYSTPNPSHDLEGKWNSHPSQRSAVLYRPKKQVVDLL